MSLTAEPQMPSVPKWMGLKAHHLWRRACCVDTRSGYSSRLYLYKYQMGYCIIDTTGIHADPCWAGWGHSAG